MKRTTNRVVKKPRITPESCKQLTAPAKKDADGWRNVGNDQFKEGNYLEAIDCYTESIACEATVLGYANRAMARLKLGEHDGADEDCTEAINLDPCFLKAYQRRAVAREALGKIEEASQDLEFAVRIEPRSETVLKSFRECLERLFANKKLRLSSKCISIPVRREKQAKEVSSIIPTIASPPVGLHVAEAKHDFFPDRATSEEEPARVSQDQEPYLTGLPPGDKVVSIDEGSEVSDMKASGRSGETLMDGATLTPKSQNEMASKVQNKALPDGASGNMNKSSNIKSGSTEQSVEHQRAASLKTIPKTPKTGGEFEAAWKSLKSESMESKSLYLTKIDVGDFLRIFKAGLSPPILMGVATCSLYELKKGQMCSGGCKFWISVLKELSKVSRFRMIAMCIGKKEKAELRELWDSAEAKLNEEDCIKSMGEIRKLYMV